MKYLKFYISNIDSNLLRSIGGRPGELIGLIKAGKFINEEAIAAKLFEGKWTYQNYLNLKNQTKKILEAYFLMNPHKKSNEIIKRMQECRKASLLAMHLIEYSKRDDAKKLLLQSYKIATKFGFTLIAYNCAVELVAGASMERKESKFKFYSQRANELLADLQAENTAQQIFYKIALHANKKRGVIKDPFTESILRLDQFSCNSTKFVQLYFMICTLRDVNNRDYSRSWINIRF